MNTPRLPLLFIVLIACLVSCKKGSQSPGVLGNWHQVKLRVYELHHDTVMYDTTYYHPFTGFDFMDFKSNGSCTVGTDHYYYEANGFYPKTPQAIAPQLSTFDYVNAGGGYVITPPNTGVTNPGGFVVTDTAFYMPGDTLRVQVIGYGHSITSTVKSVSQNYYVR